MRQILLRYLQPQMGKVVLLAVLLFGDVGLQLLNPQLLRSFIDQAMNAGPVPTLLVIAALYIVFALATQAFSAAATYFSEQVAWTSTNMLRSDLTAHCLQLDMAFHSEHPPGELIERIDGDVNALSNFFSRFALNILASILLILGVLVLLYREDWRVGLFLTGFCVVALFILRRTRSIATPSIQAFREADATLFGFIEERLRGITDIRTSRAGSYTMLRFFQFTRDLYRKGWKAAAFVNGFTAITIALFAGGYAIALTMGVYLFKANAISIGTVYLFLQYTQLIRTPLEQLSQEMRDLQYSTASIKRVRELFEHRPTILDGQVETLPGGPLSLDFASVTFAYAEGQPVLHDITFHLPAGKVLGLIGRTGSGKTTIGRLLLRLYEASEGVVSLNGQDLKTLRLAGLRERVGVVTQDVQVFEASVRDNVTFFDEGVSDEWILQVFEKLGLRTWYDALPHGLDTKISGSSLSVGEAQLLAFARLFLKDPGLVILDEASSHLDPATQRLIDGAIDTLLTNRTAIIIAHRLETLQRVDDILILEQGRITEYGAREALMNDEQSVYTRLLRTGVEDLLNEPTTPSVA